MSAATPSFSGMAKFQITYVTGMTIDNSDLETEVTANHYRDSSNGKFIDFHRNAGGTDPVLRIPADEVRQIKRITE